MLTLAGLLAASAAAPRSGVPGQHLHHARISSIRPSPRMPPATSSSSGRAQGQDEPDFRASSASATTRAGSPLWAASSGSTPTRRRASRSRPSRSTRAGNFVVVWESIGPGRLGNRHLRPAVRRPGPARRRRVPRQHLHRRPSSRPRRSPRRRPGQFRRRLAELSARMGAQQARRRPAIQRRGSAPGGRLRGQHLHHRLAARSGDRR